MAISWDALKTRKPPRAPMMLLYGPEKAGKTTLASEFPTPVFLQTEEGEGILDIATMGKVETYQELIDALDMLYNNEHDFQTVVVDSFTAAQKLVFDKTCADGDEKGNVKQRIEDFGFGKGYVNALSNWQAVLKKLDALRRDLGMTVLIIAHSTIERFDDPETVSYSRYDIDLDKRARDLIKREVDTILLLKPDVVVKSEDVGIGGRTRSRADGGRSVWMHCTSRPAYAAGNRYGLPEKTQYKPGEGYAALAPYLPGHQADLPASNAA